jgi:thioredoxin-like negative regulator of GroEL
VRDWEEVSDEASFDGRVLHATTPVIAAFEADDCGYCRQQRQLLSAAWRQLSWSVPTVRVDAFRLPAVAAAHRIVAYPTIAVFLDGRLVERFPGRRDAADVTRRLYTLLGEPQLSPTRTRSCTQRRST